MIRVLAITIMIAKIALAVLLLIPGVPMMIVGVIGSYLLKVARYILTGKADADA